MKGASLVHDLQTIRYPEEKFDKLQQAGIVTYSRLFTLLADHTSEPEIRIELCQTLWSLSRYIDKRQVVRPLLAALNSDIPDLRSAAAIAIGMMRLKRAIPQISAVVTDKNQPYLVRVHAIQALGSIADARALSVLRRIVADKSEIVGLRGDALEQTQTCVDNNSVEYYITLLSDDSPDLRFWAAYCLGQIRYQCDISPALSALDHVVLSDHTVPTYWGWHVDREAILPFEFIYFRFLSHDPEALPDNPWLISPALEYESFIAEYRHWTETWVYTTDPTPAISFHIDKVWLTTVLQQHWTTVTFNTRQPRPQSYLLDFQLVVNSQLLVGGLHHDGYALVLTGEMDAMCEFVAWYRTLFVPDQPLYLYEWAGEAINLTEHISPQDIQKLVARHIQ